MARNRIKMDLCKRWCGREFQKKFGRVPLKLRLYEAVSHFSISAVAVVKLFQALNILPCKYTEEGYTL